MILYLCDTLHAPTQTLKFGHSDEVNSVSSYLT